MSDEVTPADVGAGGRSAQGKRPGRLDFGKGIVGLSDFILKSLLSRGADLFLRLSRCAV